MAFKVQLCALICLTVLLQSCSSTGSISSRSSRVQQTVNTTSVRRRTVCQFTSQELQDTVQATFASVISHGVFPRSWEEKFHQLQTLITSQVSHLRETITVLEQRIIEQSEEQISSCGGGQRSSATSSARHSAGRSVTTVQSSAAISSRADSLLRATTYEQAELTRAREALVHGSRPILPAAPPSQLLTSSSSSSSTHRSAVDSNRIYGHRYYASETDVLHQYSQAAGSRMEEVIKYNNTIHMDEDGRRVYTYYWVITDMSRKMHQWTLRESTRSSMFYVARPGYHMYMRMTPRYSEDSIYLHVGLTKGDFDDAISWPYNHPMRLYVLSHSRSPDSYDLQSRIWNPWELCSGSNWKKPSRGDNTECVGLGFPHTTLNHPEYLWNDCLTVKLNVYLD